MTLKILLGLILSAAIGGLVAFAVAYLIDANDPFLVAAMTAATLLLLNSAFAMKSSSKRN